jgi:hypothetical protein
MSEAGFRVTKYEEMIVSRQPYLTSDDVDEMCLVALMMILEYPGPGMLLAHMVTSDRTCQQRVKREKRKQARVS